MTHLNWVKTQSTINILAWTISYYIKQRLEDQHKEQWQDEVNESSKSTWYRMFKKEFKFEQYLFFAIVWKKNVL